MRRRTFLLGAAGLGLSLAWRSLGAWPFLGTSASRSERLAGLLNHEESARIVGREYLRLVPAEASRGVLTSRVVERLPGGFRTMDAVSDDRLRELLLRSTLEDFEEERIVELRGWVLSRTEARLCGLAAWRGRSMPA
ncbi:MAG: hypothetical protein ACRDON_08280 [Gaiellaceae bacterium]